MNQLQLARPDVSEYYPPYHADYVGAVPAGPLRPLLEQQVEALRDACARLTDAGALHRYAPDKWSIKEVLGHVSDSERVFAYRLLCFVRGDPGPLPGFDQDLYVAGADFDARRLDELLDEFSIVRAATLALLHSVRQEDWSRRGTANQREMSARGLAYIIAGHAQHHLRILRDRYDLAIELP